MILLSPTNALIATAVAVPLLLLLYMLKLRRRPMRVSTVAFWLRAPEDTQANQPLQPPRPSWLLLLHALLIAAIILAVGRPALQDPSPASPLTIFIIDQSASMAVIDAGQTQTRLQLAKAAAQAQCERALSGRSDRRVAVITCGLEAQVASSWTSAATLATAAIGQIEQTDQPASLARALELAKVIASNANEDGGPPEVAAFFYTDGVMEVPGTIGTLSSDGSMRIRSSIPIEIKQIGPVTKLKSPASSEASPQTAPLSSVQNNIVPLNRGLTMLSASRGEGADARMLTLFIEVASTFTAPVGGSMADDVPIVVRLNEGVLARRVVTVSQATATSTLQLIDVGSGVLNVQIELEDALASDNRAAMVLQAMPLPAILLVQPGNETSAAQRLLADVLAEVEHRRLTTITLAEYVAGEGEGDGAKATATSGEEYNCIIFDGVSPPRLPRVASLSFGASPPVNRVGRVGRVTGDNNMIEGEGTTLPVPDESVTFFWQRGHPLLRNISLDSLVIGDPSHFVISAGGQPVIDEIVTSRDGPIVIAFAATPRERGVAVRHVATSFELSGTNWPLQASFAIFVADALNFVTNRSDTSAGRSYRTNQPVMLRLEPALQASDNVLLVGPARITLPVPNGNGDEGTIPGSVTNSPAQMRELFAPPLPRVGVYRISANGEEGLPQTWREGTDQVVAVNLLDRIETLLEPRPMVAASATRPRLENGNAARPDVLAELWPYCIGIALALLCLEWHMYGQSRRKG